MPTHIPVLRRLGLERNPLRRTTDLLETAARIAALALCLAAVPLAVWIGVAVHRQMVGLVEYQHANRMSRTATVQADPPQRPGRLRLGSHPAPVSWSMPDGSRRTATVTVLDDARRGSTVTLWVTLDGRQTTAPLPSTAPASYAVLTVAGVEAAVVAVAGASLWLARRLLDRFRYRRWAEAWAVLAIGARR